tara:strand:- start:44 stop:691 length:648 start_codon:yes stop_codon:yes gene_type:complete
MNKKIDFKNIRINYKKLKIDFNNLKDCPIDLFLDWFHEALSTNKHEANACVLSTVSIDNKPSSRVVLIKEVNKEGFIFFTNYRSDKSTDIHCNPNVSLNFYWPELERQVRICGVANKIPNSDSDDYFNSRPRESQLGALLSDQSLSVSMDHDFMKVLDTLKIKFEGKEVKRPLHWGGYCVLPRKIEFWQGRPSRLHHRLMYVFDGKRWHKERLAP